MATGSGIDGKLVSSAGRGRVRVSSERGVDCFSEFVAGRADKRIGYSRDDRAKDDTITRVRELGRVEGTVKRANPASTSIGAATPIFQQAFSSPTAPDPSEISRTPASATLVASRAPAKRQGNGLCRRGFRIHQDSPSNRRREGASTLEASRTRSLDKPFDRPFGWVVLNRSGGFSGRNRGNKSMAKS